KERVPSEILPFSRVQTKLLKDMARYHQRAHIDALTSDIVDASTIVLAPNIIRESAKFGSVPD
ncbi:MAG: hypothetical protein KUG56_09625, partial [Kordiimonadaceae bacterium]|nr:hypothetical protein [Kordiimonadaceae bacterium]